MKYIITERQSKLLPLLRRLHELGKIIYNTDAYMEPYYYDTFTDFWQSITSRVYDILMENEEYNFDFDSVQELIGEIFGEELRKWYYDNTDPEKRYKFKM